ncbi:MAG: Tfp pilus assembly protein FimT/FimU [Sulfuricurvum sp.]|uniref:pilus assembly FimT family protein n=1 Tax=Sulfuricurvum sp. TaxID=2025608 RepID=UPI003D1277D0
MRSARRGMSLFELLIVMTIVGIVYSIGIFSIKAEKVTSSNISLNGIKKALLALDYNGKLRLLCDNECESCRIYTGETQSSSILKLPAHQSIQRYGFNRFGDLEPLEAVVSDEKDKMVQGCFEYTLYPDGTSTFLLLRSGGTFYLYTPLGGDEPFVTQSEERLKEELFSAARYPLNSDDYARE